MTFVYLVRCSDGTLYVGHAENLAVREQMHNAGTGASYTAARLPVRMVYAEQFESADRAIAREHQIKRWTAKKKEALVNGASQKLKGYSAGAKNPPQFTWRDWLRQS